MGIEINKTTFVEEDRLQFQHALEGNLGVLAELLAQPGFGCGAKSLGAELEIYIVDQAGFPLHVNQEIHDAAADHQLTLELNKYNLEYNLSPWAIEGSAFAATEAEILDKLSRARVVAEEFSGRIVPIGILPTLRQSDFGMHCITDRKRYHALVSQLLKRRGGQFRIDIDGPDPLKLDMSDITLEGANTSFQVHYRVAPEDYADTFNAIQLVTPLALAIAANSPMLFGHQLWHETRIPLFKQAIDTRQLDRYGWNEPARVNFGQGWVRRDALELFTETVRIYPPLLPICAAQSSRDEVAAGKIPSLAELRLHQSTVWLWNRPVYDDADGGHLRIEMRSLPAGPTAVDMVANAAFLIGLAEGIRPRIAQLLPAIPFGIAEYNFYRAAQHGLDAQLLWPEQGQSGYREQGIRAVIDGLLPTAQQGLLSIGVPEVEALSYLGIIRERLEKNQTGATWQRAKLQSLQVKASREEALHALLECYMGNSADNIPVAEWSL
jgi:gamma-glutamyl:cysteine ligase YbdK (ATP-grasp superfamily)